MSNIFRIFAEVKLKTAKMKNIIPETDILDMGQIAQKEEPKQDWYCPKCQSYVSSVNVTFEETHQLCNTGVIILEPKTTGDISVDYTIAQSKAIQKCMHLDAEMAYKSLSKQEHNKYLSCCRSKEECHCSKNRKQETLEEDKNGSIIQFLCGSHSYDGVWFGDKHPYREGNFWWRSILQEQDKNKFSEEDMKEAFESGTVNQLNFTNKKPYQNSEEWFEQFKKR
jgi:hypothetical protein